VNQPADSNPDSRIGKFEHRSISCTVPGCSADHLHRRAYGTADPWVPGEYVQSEAGSTWTPAHAPEPGCLNCARLTAGLEALQAQLRELQAQLLASATERAAVQAVREAVTESGEP